MPESYHTIQEEAAAEFVEKRSRFIGQIRPVTGEEEAKEFLARIRGEHRDARHHCFAWVLRQGQIQRYGDDGEPQGTAGVPMLEVLRREGIQDVAVVVTRYFGGILLGAGGLVRAYSHTAKLAVDAARRVEMCPCVRLALEVPYPLYERVRLLLEKWGGAVLGTDFTDQVILEVRIKTESLPGLQGELTELSGGGLEALPMGEEFAPI